MPSVHTIFYSLLNGEIANDEQLRAAFGRKREPYALVALVPTSDAPAKEPDAVSALADVAGPVYAIAAIDGLAMGLVSYARAEQAIESMAAKLGIEANPAIVSLPFDSLEEAPHQFDLVKYTLQHDKADGVCFAQESALAYLTASIKRNIHTTGMLHPALNIIADYDQANQSELLNTLRVYLDNDCNAQKCGRLLFLHRNSLVYRVRRIQEISGCNLNDPQERAYLRLSFLLYDQE